MTPMMFAILASPWALTSANRAHAFAEGFPKPKMNGVTRQSGRDVILGFAVIVTNPIASIAQVISINGRASMNKTLSCTLTSVRSKTGQLIISMTPTQKTKPSEGYTQF